jgi:leucyl/phenylalanyl-tRNA---protein transferase
MSAAKLTADDLIYGYMHGLFPMAEPDDGTLYWYSPDPRAIIPIEMYHPPKSLRPVLNSGRFEVRINNNFRKVMEGCAAPRKDNESTWISSEIIDSYTELQQAGFAYSVETYLQGELVGGLYGVAIGGAFFGESMFHTESNASKVAFHYLIQILRIQGYELLDTQFMNDNVRRFGAIEISRTEYLQLLRKALEQKCHFNESSLNYLFQKS